MVCFCRLLTETLSAETQRHDFHSVLHFPHFHPASVNNGCAELICTLLVPPTTSITVQAFVCCPIITFPAHLGPLTWAAGYQPGRQKPIIRTWLFPRLHKNYMESQTSLLSWTQENCISRAADCPPPRTVSGSALSSLYFPSQFCPSNCGLSTVRIQLICLWTHRTEIWVLFI